jgi:hypothetical protein
MKMQQVCLLKELPFLEQPEDHSSSPEFDFGARGICFALPWKRNSGSPAPQQRNTRLPGLNAAARGMTVLNSKFEPVKAETLSLGLSLIAYCRPKNSHGLHPCECRP